MTSVLTLPTNFQKAGYLSLLAGVGSASATLLALSYFRPNNLGQNDLSYDWKKLSLISAIGSTLTLHYGVTGDYAMTAAWSSLKSLFSK